jgi:hypothetical protein
LLRVYQGRPHRWTVLCSRPIRNRKDAQNAQTQLIDEQEATRKKERQVWTILCDLRDHCWPGRRRLKVVHQTKGCVYGQVSWVAKTVDAYDTTTAKTIRIVNGSHWNGPVSNLRSLNAYGDECCHA